MGIVNIHILQEDDGEAQRRAQRELLMLRADEHRRGMHAGDGNKRRDCPFCVEGR